MRYSSAVSTARDYYNSDDADNFYAIIWGGEDIHIGIYESGSEPIFEASQRTVRKLAAMVPALGPDKRVLDLGSGYGGAARYLASTCRCHVTALNLSEAENERHRRYNRERNLESLIDVVDGSFEELSAQDAYYDVIWSQDAILHSGDREKVIAEAARVLKPGGHFVFTDPMQANDCPAGVLEPILARIHLQNLGSPAFYREAGQRAGLRLVEYDSHTDQLVRHYTRVLEETTRREGELSGHVSADYIARMKQGLEHWIEGGRKGWLAWGLFHFQKD